MTGVTQHAPADHYAANHQHPANRVLHAIGTPIIAGCVITAILGPNVLGASRRTALGGVAAGSALLLLGHVIEGNRPAILTRRGAVLDAVRRWARGAARLVRQACQ